MSVPPQASTNSDEDMERNGNARPPSKDEDDDEEEEELEKEDEEQCAPYFSPMPPTNPFSYTQGVVKMTPVRLVTQLEAFFFSKTSIRRAAGFAPQKGDVFLVGAPCSGEIAFGRALRRLVAVDPTKRLDHAGTCPWIESSYVDARPGICLESQTNARNRIFYTTMTVGAASPSRHRASASYIVLLRHPADLRAAWFAHLRRVWEIYYPSSKNNNNNSFHQMFVPDDFVSLGVLLCSPEMSQGLHTYERFASEWYRESISRGGSENVLIVLYEALLISPERELKRIHDFLSERDPPRSRRPHLEENRLRLAMRDMGSSQQSGRSLDGRRASFAARLARRLRKRSESSSASLRKSFATLNSKLEDNFVGFGEASYTLRGSVIRLQADWTESFGFVKLASYDKLYEHIIGSESYPFPQVQNMDTQHQQLTRRRGGQQDDADADDVRLVTMSLASDAFVGAVKAGRAAAAAATYSATDTIKSLRDNWRKKATGALSTNTPEIAVTTTTTNSAVRNNNATDPGEGVSAAVKHMSGVFFSNSIIPSSLNDWEGSVSANPNFSRPTFESVDLSEVFPPMSSPSLPPSARDGASGSFVELPEAGESNGFAAESESTAGLRLLRSPIQTSSRLNAATAEDHQGDMSEML